MLNKEAKSLIPFCLSCGCRCCCCWFLLVVLWVPYLLGRVIGIEVGIIRTTKAKHRVSRNHRETVGEGDIAPPATRLVASQIIRVLITDPIGGISNYLISTIIHWISRHLNGDFRRLFSIFFRRRDSHGSTYELVDSEAQWREIQERQALQQSQTATVRPAASSTPVQQQPVQQATVRKASNAVNVSTSSVNDSLLDQSQSDLTAVETNSQTSSRHRHHRKHKHHHKHR